MAKMEISGESKVEAAVTAEGVTLFKSGQQIAASPDSVAALEADGWLPFEADLAALAAELGVWSRALEQAADEFARVVRDDGVIDAAEGAQLHVLQKAMTQTGEAYNRLYRAAFIMYGVKQESPAEEGDGDGN